MNDSNPRQRVLHDAALWAVGLLPVVYVWVAMFHLPEHYVRLVTEDCIGETATASMWIGAGVLWTLAARRAKRESGPWVMTAIFAAAALFVGLEEISWGQRLVGIGLPWLQAVNEQREVNLHNLLLATHVVERTLVPLLALLYGLVLPLAARISETPRSLARRRNIPIPPLQAVPLFVTAIVFFLPLPFMLGHVELAELFLGMGLLVTAGTHGAGARTSAGARRAAVAFAVCLGLALGVVELGPRSRAERFLNGTRLLFAQGVYPRRGMLGASNDLLRQEAARSSDWLRVATASGALAEMTVNRHVGGPQGSSANRLAERFIVRAEEDVVNTTIDLALLARIAGRDEAASRHLEDAGRMVDRFEAPPGDERAMLLARARLLGCQGRVDEALALFPLGGPPRIVPRRRLVLERRIRDYAKVFGQ